MSTDSERDQSIDRILRKGARLRSGATDVGGEACLDAETFAAWAEGALTEADAARVEAHLADCTRCQALMASFATSEPAAATGAAPVVIPFRPRSPMQWLITVAAGTAAASLLVWTAWPKPDVPDMNVPASQTMAKADAPLPTPMAPIGELASPPAQQAREGKELMAKSEAAPAQAKLAEESRIADTRSKALQPTFRTATPTATANDASAKPLPAPSAAPPPPPNIPPPFPPTPRPLPGAMPPPPTVANAGAQATTQNAPPVQNSVQNQQQAQQGGVRTEPPTISVAGSSDIVQNLPRADRNALNFLTFMPGTVEFGPPDSQPTLDRTSTVGMGRGGAGGSASGGAAGAGGAGAGGRSAAAAERTMPVTNVRWRILPTGEVGKTTDAGTTWQAIVLVPKVHITQGAAPSATVCWLVGKAGVVLLSTDGGTKFTPLTFPEAVDLRSITAIDARRATVTTTAGRTFATIDGGISWK